MALSNLPDCTITIVFRVLGSSGGSHEYCYAILVINYLINPNKGIFVKIILIAVSWVGSTLVESDLISTVNRTPKTV